MAKPSLGYPSSQFYSASHPVQHLPNHGKFDAWSTLHLAASTLECTVEQALRELLEQRVPFDYAMIRERAVPAKLPVPELATPAVPDLRVFDALLAEGVRRNDLGTFGRANRYGG